MTTASVSMRARTDGSDWPIPWPAHLGDHWPKIATERWVPTRAGPAVVMCVRTRSLSGASEIIAFDTAEEAVEAARTLYDRRCGKGCERHHVIAWTEPGRLHVHSVDQPRVMSRAEAIARAYPRPRREPRSDPASWPTPSILNQPLGPRGTPMNFETRQQDTAVEQSAGRELHPEPGGLPARVAAAQAEAEAALAAGDLDEAFGADMLADALVSAALCELETASG